MSSISPELQFSEMDILELNSEVGRPVLIRESEEAEVQHYLLKYTSSAPPSIMHAFKTPEGRLGKNIHI